MHLYRPVGLAELALIAESGWRAYPPRLAFQPIFYPVLNFRYAEEIARDWNPKDEASGFVGFVTEFDVEDAFVSRYRVELAGAPHHQELWVPAEELDAFNAHIEGTIRVTAHYVGERFAGRIDEATHLPVGMTAPA